jgi:hypothetical protein
VACGREQPVSVLDARTRFVTALERARVEGALIDPTVWHMAVDAGSRSLVVVDLDGQRVLVCDVAGNGSGSSSELKAGTGTKVNTGAAISLQETDLKRPNGVAVLGAEEDHWNAVGGKSACVVYVASSQGRQIVRYDVPCL